METLNKLDRKINDILNSVKQPVSVHGGLDTCSILFELASKSKWRVEELKKFDFLSKKLNINKKIFLELNSNSHKAVNFELSNQTWLDLAIAILFKAILIQIEEAVAAIQLKRFNTLFKAMDVVIPQWLSPGTDLGEALEIEWEKLLKNLPESNHFDNCSYKNKKNQAGKNFITIPIIIMFYEGPIARAYLETIKSLGFKPKKILELVAEKDVVTKKSVGKWLPNNIRQFYAGSIQRNKCHYWPKKLIRKRPGFVNKILSEVQLKFGFSRECIDAAHSLLPLSAYCDTVEPLLVDGLNDDRLFQYLSKESSCSILYTGGGIVPSVLFGIQHLKFLHIHPGFLPKIRGADCALWSTLLTGQTSASCFYMSPGIDIGDIIHACWLPEVSINADTKGIDLQFIYRSIYSFFDPWIRAYVLRDLMEKTVEFNVLNSEPQKEVDGLTFHFMHHRLQQIAFKKLFG